MRAGAKDRRIRVDRLTTARSKSGQPVETWAEWSSLWAQRLEGSKVTERFAGDERFATVTTIFKVAYSPAYAELDPAAHRVVFKGQIYNILGVVELGRNVDVELLCVARGEK